MKADNSSTYEWLDRMVQDAYVNEHTVVDEARSLIQRITEPPVEWQAGAITSLYRSRYDQTAHPDACNRSLTD